MIITYDKLNELDACPAGLIWFKKKYVEQISLNDLTIDLIKNDKEEWLNWLIPRLLTKDQCVQYAIYAADVAAATNAAHAAIAAANAAHAAAYAAIAAANAAHAAADKTNKQIYKQIYKQILDYGLKLIENQETGHEN